MRMGMDPENLPAQGQYSLILSCGSKHRIWESILAAWPGARILRPVWLLSLLGLVVAIQGRLRAASRFHDSKCSKEEDTKHGVCLDS